jgi:DNA repair exonuclease SbcCD ATPase subunit
VVLFAAFTLVFISVVPVYAQTNSTSVSQEVFKRIEERKTRLKTKLDSAQTKRLTERCTAAQDKIQQIIDKSVKKNDDAQKTYEAYINRLQELDQKLADNGTKSTELLQEIATLKEKYAALASASSTFQNALSDGKTLDCKKDPTAFKAAVDDARSQAEIIKKTRQDLWQYVHQKVIPTLETLKHTVR